MPKFRTERYSDLDLLTSKLVSESRVMWATSVPIIVFLGSISSKHTAVGNSHGNSKFPRKFFVGVNF